MIQKNYIRLLILICVSIFSQSCTSILKCVADHKFPPKYEATIKTESVKKNFCALRSFDRVDLALSLNIKEINQAIQANLVVAREKLKEMGKISIGKIEIDSIHLNTMSVYSEEQYIGVKTVVSAFFSEKTIVKSVDIEFDGSLTASAIGENISLQPFLTGNGIKILKVKSKFFIFGLPFIKNLVNKVISTIKDNINSKIPAINFNIKIPVFPDRKFSSLLTKVSNLEIITDAELKIDYHFLTPAMIMDANNLKIMTQIVDDSYKGKLSPCLIENINDITDMDNIIQQVPSVLSGVNTQKLMTEIRAKHFSIIHFYDNYKPRRKKNKEKEAIIKFLQLYSYYKFVYDTIRVKYLTPDLTLESAASMGNISKDLVQRATTNVFDQAKAFKVQYNLIGKPVHIKEFEIKAIDNPNVNCQIFNTSCNLVFDCNKVISPCNQDCKWNKPWNCAAKLACNLANGVKWGACQVADIPLRAACLAKATITGAICLTEIVGKFALYHFLRVGTMSGDISFNAKSTLGLKHLEMKSDLNSANVGVTYNATGKFATTFKLVRDDIGGYILCPFPTAPISFTGEVTSSSADYDVGTDIQPSVIQDTTVLDFTTHEDPITFQFMGKDGKSPLQNLIDQNPTFFFLSCPISITLITIGSVGIEIFGNDKLKKDVEALYTGFYSQKLPNMKFHIKIEPIKLKSDFKNYTMVSQWRPKSIQFTLK